MPPAGERPRRRFAGHSRKSADEVGRAINDDIYDHKLKLSLSAIHLNGAPLVSETTALQPGDDGMQHMAQVQMAF